MAARSLKVSTLVRVLAVLAIVLAKNFLPVEYASPFMVGLGALLMVTGTLELRYVRLIAPLLAVLALGAVGLSGHQPRDVLRDLSFALTPIALLYVGYWLARGRAMWPRLLTVLVIGAWIVSVAHLCVFAQHLDLLGADRDLIRKEVGGTDELVAFALVVLVAARHLRLGRLLPNWLPLWLVLPVLLASSVLSFSRTQFAVGVVMLLATCGWLTRARRVLVLVGAVAVLVLAAGALGSHDDGLDFTSRIVNFVDEIAFADYADQADINRNWRGFESYLALKTMDAGSLAHWMFGYGFGAVVDLGFLIELGSDVPLSAIPIMHNGYVYVLYKTGIAGLAAYVLFYLANVALAVRRARPRPRDPERTALALVMLGAVLSLAVIMVVVGGMPQMHGTELVLVLGFCHRRLTREAARPRPAPSREVTAKGRAVPRVAPRPVELQ